jgi:hypothetical protein
VGRVPVAYAGVRFRSTLEADWAVTLDGLNVIWQYEPEAVRLPSGTLYRPDFYLPKIATWLEVKGPSVGGLDKTRELAEAVSHFPDCPARGRGDCECTGEYELVVVGLAPTLGRLTWELVGDDTGTFQRCFNCGSWWWCGSVSLGCRAHRRFRGGDDDLGDDTVPEFRRSGGRR